MATQEDSTENALWDISVTSGKSWVELVEEDDVEFALINKRHLKSVSPAKGSSPYFQFDKCDNSRKEETIGKRDSLPVLSSVKAEVTLEQEISTTELPPLKNVTQTYANILKSSPLNGPISPDALKKSEPPRIEVKKEFLQEDLSLTGHLDGFQLTSPCKPVTIKQEFKTPNKLITKDKASTSSPRNPKRKMFEAPESTDTAHMPSPSKIARPSESPSIHSTPSSANKNTFNNRKRLRENTPRSKPSRPRETDPEVLARRQKQIDYGKNTIGYERYCEAVPKESRVKSVHPKTPPMHLKYSRRGWDGMVRIWRQRLHFWDPPSEGGGNPECLEECDNISDISSTDGSLPNTPVQAWKRRPPPDSPAISRPGTSYAHPPKEEFEEDFDNQGCVPLSPE